MLRVIAQPDIARMQHALMADRRDHEHQHVARHHPVRNRLLQILQRLAAQALRARLRMEDARRHADAQRTLRDPLAGAVEDLARPRRHHAAEHRPRGIRAPQIGRRRLGRVGRAGRDRRRIRCGEIGRGAEFGRQPRRADLDRFDILGRQGGLRFRRGLDLRGKTRLRRRLAARLRTGCLRGGCACLGALGGGLVGRLDIRRARGLVGRGALGGTRLRARRRRRGNAGRRRGGTRRRRRGRGRFAAGTGRRCRSA